MIRIEKLTHYIFYFAVVLFLFSSTNIEAFVHHEGLNVVIACLGLVLYAYYLKGRRFTTDMVFSVACLSLYGLFAFIFRQKMSVDWLLVCFLIFVPLIRADKIKFLQGLFLTKLTVVFIIILLTLLDFIPDTVLTKLGLQAHSLGFFHPNTLGAVSLSLLCDLCLLFQKHRGRLLTFFFFLQILATYYITYSRTACIIMVLLLLVFMGRRKLQDRVITPLRLALSSLVVMLTGVLISLYYSPYNQLYSFLDKFLTNRIYLGNKYINLYGFTLFPKKTPNIIPLGWWSSDQLFNDNTYLKFVLGQGILLSIVIALYIFYNLISKTYSVYHALMIFIILVYLIIEAQSFNVFLFTPLLFEFMARSKKETPHFSVERSRYENS